MMLLYRIFGYIIYCLVYPWGRLRAAFGDEKWRGRLALRGCCGAADIWLHAASVGEVRVISYLVDYLRTERPSLRMHVTVMTRAGYATAKSLFGEHVSVSFLPLDVHFLQIRAAGYIQPKAMVIAETELWPHLIRAISDRSVPIILVNARMTERALRRYLWFRRTFTYLLSRYDRIFAKSEEDRSRFLRLGATPDLCRNAGDMKFDAPLLERSDEKTQEIRESLGVKRDEFLLVAGSTREGEEALLFRMYQSLRSDNTRFRLVIAPRHLDRLGEIEMAAQSLGLRVRRDSVNAERSAEDIVLVDRMGLLNDLYMAADLAFVGGTLVEIGGHNVLEPVWAGTPVLFGPSVSNVREAAEYIAASRFGAQVADAAELEDAIRKYVRREITFRVKTGDDLTHSPTAHVGDHILRKLDRA
ncbi:hypothetical protein C3F09_09350 [candidate division GN15 bacterium]|uniref:3-deoxy-D-manno-octulosonic acid transferase n=1 Tax=candidate division GN15 bacterium TaxID=2072418 RepID=A0A855WXV6_9BACT|nr:MAG: hypothetical protein C3F09_09350 [candidate division GN15 bacterium]